MKKLAFIVAVLATAGLSSCGNAPKATFSNEIDSLSYMAGIANTQGLDMYYEQQLGLDSTVYAEFVRGVEAGLKKTTKKDEAYMAGLQVGQSVGSRMYEMMNGRLFANDSVNKLNKNNMLAGFVDAIKHHVKVSPDSANIYYETKSKAIKAKINEVKYADNKAAGEKFLAENAKNDSVQTTPSGLQYKILKVGKGPVPAEDATVKVHYRGTTINGEEFDSSYSRQEPTSFNVNGVIPGWTEALKMMPEGSKWMIYIPQELAYGAEGAGAKIDPYSTLVFEVELLDAGAKK